MREPEIVVNGVSLDTAQACAIRCAVTHFEAELADPEYRELLGEIGTLYRARLREVLTIILRNA